MRTTVRTWGVDKHSENTSIIVNPYEVHSISCNVYGKQISNLLSGHRRAI